MFSSRLPWTGDGGTEDHVGRDRRSRGTGRARKWGRGRSADTRLLMEADPRRRPAVAPRRPGRPPPFGSAARRGPRGRRGTSRSIAAARSRHASRAARGDRFVVRTEIADRPVALGDILRRSGEPDVVDRGHEVRAVGYVARRARRCSPSRSQGGPRTRPGRTAPPGLDRHRRDRSGVARPGSARTRPSRASSARRRVSPTMGVAGSTSMPSPSIRVDDGPGGRTEPRSTCRSAFRPRRRAPPRGAEHEVRPHPGDARSRGRQDDAGPRRRLAGG